MERLVAIYGAGGFGREVAPLVGAKLFLSDDPSSHSPGVIGLDDLPPEYLVSIAIADGAVRKLLVEKCEAAGRAFATVNAPTAIRRGRSTIGEGAVLCDFTVITDNVIIGRHFHCNIYSYVAHDCVIGDFVTLAPKVCVNGNVHIGDGAYIGTGAVLKNGRPDRPIVIGEGAVIGCGAVVTKDVPAFATMIGNPARPLIKAVAA